jgi:phosphopantothenoylcysteine synthetase/decarboxylase
MNIIVTCGPSYEPIDEVRRITNFSTGELGSRLARALARAGHAVTCFKGVAATTKESAEPARVVAFTTNDDLAAQLRALPDRAEVGAVFHAAALADFKIEWARDGQRKISSRAGAVTLTLVPSSKVIRELRELFPQARLVGWKYELDGTREDALAKAKWQLADNRTDVCVINGIAYGRGFGVVTAGQPPVHLADTTALCAWAAEWTAGGISQRV